MPPRLPVLSRLSRLLTSRRRPLELYYCPSCSLWRISDSQRPAVPRRLHTRAASTLASSTAINPPIEVAPHNQELYKALDALKNSAANYVNLSRLQLALRGLQARDPVVRVAVLGMGDQKSAVKLARLLLADPLAPTGQWEKELEDRPEDGRNLLLRYGDDSDVHPRNPLLQTISVPSRVLQNHNLEILISTLDVSSPRPSQRLGGEDGPRDAILVPTLRTPTSYSGREVSVTYPVHRAILLGKGIEGAVSYGRFISGTDEQEICDTTVKVALMISAEESVDPNNGTSSIALLDLDLAHNSLAKFRESMANAVVYERGWFRSGMHALSGWLTRSIRSPELRVNLAVQDLVRSLLDDTGASISAEEARVSQNESTSSISEKTRLSMLDTLGSWAERGHFELQQELDMAFSSKNWRKLAWWKLFWRVDDVSMIASELVERRWLVEAEKKIIWIAGRMTEAGYLQGGYSASGQRKAQGMASPPRKRRFFTLFPDKYLDAPSQTAYGEHWKKVEIEEDTMAISREMPWPLDISVARTHIFTATIAPLQALAQKLVLQTISTTTLTSVLSALIYISMPAVSVYEAGVVAVIGLVWSLRRLQTRWEGARLTWQGDIKEEGRQALKTTEGELRLAINTSGRVKADPVGAEDRRTARDAVLRAREVLVSLRKTGL